MVEEDCEIWEKLAICTRFILTWPLTNFTDLLFVSIQVHVMIEYCLIMGLDACQTESMLFTQGVPRCMTRIGKKLCNRSLPSFTVCTLACTLHLSIECTLIRIKKSLPEYVHHHKLLKLEALHRNTSSPLTRNLTHLTMIQTLTTEMKTCCSVAWAGEEQSWIL